MKWNFFWKRSIFLCNRITVMYFKTHFRLKNVLWNECHTSTSKNQSIFSQRKSPRYFDLVYWHFSWKFKSFWNKFSMKKQTHCDNCSSLLKNWKVCQWSYPGFISKSANFCIDPWTWHGKFAISAPPSNCTWNEISLRTLFT